MKVRIRTQRHLNPIKIILFWAVLRYSTKLSPQDRFLSTYFSVMEKYIEDVRQDEKHVPDLLEAIMRLPGLVKEELRPILSKVSQFRPEITKIRI